MTQFSVLFLTACNWIVNTLKRIQQISGSFSLQFITLSRSWTAPSGSEINPRFVSTKFLPYQELNLLVDKFSLSLSNKRTNYKSYLAQRRCWSPAILVQAVTVCVFRKKYSRIIHFQLKHKFTLLIEFLKLYPIQVILPDCIIDPFSE